MMSTQQDFFEIQIDMACWPEFLRRKAGLSDDSLTGEQRKAAAQKLRARADELDPLHEAERIAILESALQKIERWFGEFPPKGKHWPTGEPMTYGAAYGSNGQRDFMRQVARDAGISTGTVKVYMSHIFGKTGAANRTELARWSWDRAEIAKRFTDTLRLEWMFLQLKRLNSADLPATREEIDAHMAAEKVGGNEV